MPDTFGVVLFYVKLVGLLVFFLFVVRYEWERMEDNDDACSLLVAAAFLAVMLAAIITITTFALITGRLAP